MVHHLMTLMIPQHYIARELELNSALQPEVKHGNSSTILLPCGSVLFFC